MKKTILLVCVAAVALLASCVKEKTCRCSVPASQSVHIITIEGGDCAELNTMEYSDEDMNARRDSLYCIEYNK